MLPSELRSVSKADFDAFVAGFPRPLTRRVCHDFDPPLVTFNDPMVAPRWPDTIVAADSDGDPPRHWQILPGADTA